MTGLPTIFFLFGYRSINWGAGLPDFLFSLLARPLVPTILAVACNGVRRNGTSLKGVCKGRAPQLGTQKARSFEAG